MLGACLLIGQSLVGPLVMSLGGDLSSPFDWWLAQSVDWFSVSLIG